MSDNAILYYDRNGVPIDRVAAMELFAEPRVAATEIGPDVDVSTVHLVMDHRWFDNGGRPLIFETMIFGGEYDQWAWRYATEEDARVGHERVVSILRAGGDPGE